jgi:hypothetical protein
VTRGSPRYDDRSHSYLLDLTKVNPDKDEPNLPHMDVLHGTLLNLSPIRHYILRLLGNYNGESAEAKAGGDGLMKQP